MTDVEAGGASEAGGAGEPAAARLVRSSAIVGVGTALSRITGVLRIGAITYALGASGVADAYNLGNTTPNIIYELILGGILSATLVPIFVDRFEHDDAEGVSAVATVSVVALVALTVAAVLAAPVVFDIYTWRKPADEAAELARVGVPLARLFLPQILFYGLTALGTAMLHARRSFRAPAMAPVLNNVLVCAALVAFARIADRSPSLEEVRGDATLLWLLGAGTTLGIVAMTVVLWPAIRATGIRLRWRFQPRHPAVRKVASLSGWTVGYVAANQIALAVVLALAAQRTGGASAYTYAFVFFQLPHGLFAVSLMTTIVPDLSSFASRGDTQGYRDRFGLGLRLMLLVMVPAAVGYALLAKPLVSGLLVRGALTGASADLVADILAALAFGLVGFSVYLFALRGFYALRDTRTPFVLNLIENAINVVLALAFVGRWGVQGLAAAYAGAYTIAAVLALGALRARVRRIGSRQVLRSVVKVALATAVMAAVVWPVSRAVGADSGNRALARTAAGVVTGAVVYGIALLVLRVDEVAALRARLTRARG